MSKNEEWETEDVEVAKPVGAVISVRFPQEIADRIFAEARRRGVKTSVVVREAVEAALSHAPASASDVQLSTVANVNLSFYSGRSRTGRTVTAATPLEPAGATSD